MSKPRAFDLRSPCIVRAKAGLLGRHLDQGIWVRAGE
jgi:hypothetical protein